MSTVYLNRKFIETLPVDKKNKKLYIVLSSTNTMAARMIKIITDAKYAHTSISLDDKLNHMYSFARKEIHNPLNAGLVVEDIRSGMFKKMPDTEIAVFEMLLPSMQYEDIENTIQDFWDRRDELKYNLFALKMLVLGGYKMKRYDQMIDYYIRKDKEIRKNGKEAYFCSQFVTTILEQNNIKLFNRPAEVVTPQDFYSVLKERATLTYEGLAYEYYSKLSPVGEHYQNSGFALRKTN